MCYDVLLCKGGKKFFKNLLFLRDGNLAVNFLVSRFLSLIRQTFHKKNVFVRRKQKIIGGKSMKAKIAKFLRNIFGSNMKLIFSKDYGRISGFLCFLSHAKEIVIVYGNYADGYVMVFLDQKTGEKISHIWIESHSFDKSFSLSSSGEEVMFVVDDYYLIIIDREKGKVFRENFGEAIISQSFSPSGKEILFVEGFFGRKDSTLKILDRETEEEVFSMTFEASDRSPSFSPSGEEIMLPKGNHNLTVLNRKNREEIFSKNFAEWTGSLNFSPSGERIMLSKYQRVLTVLDSKTGEEIFSKEFKERIFSLNFSPSGKRIMLKEDDKLKILDSGTGEEIFSKDIDNFSNPIFGMSDEIVIIRKGRSRLESYRIKI